MRLISVHSSSDAAFTEGTIAATVLSDVDGGIAATLRENNESTINTQERQESEVFRRFFANYL